jgi:hypothetical protein
VLRGSAGRYHGLSREQIEEVFQKADLFIDHLRTCEWADEATTARLRVMVDGEPGFTQMQMIEKLESGQPVISFDQYYSVGLNVGSAASSVPTAGKIWHPIVDPVVLELFPCQPTTPNAPFTTVMSWQAHPPIHFEGQVYGQKDLEFPKFIELPRLTTARLEVAIAGKDVPTGQLENHGWRVRNSTEVTATFDSWVQYLQRSSGEFSVCKNVFVATNSGFFSDRSAAYLASGRPVVMQETGFSSHIPCGRGLFAVHTVEEAAAAIDEIRGDYERHSKWAREIAAEYLEAGKVLGRFLHELGM